MRKQVTTVAAVAFAAVLTIGGAGWAGETAGDDLTRAEAKAAVQDYLSERGLDHYRVARLTQSDGRWSASVSNRHSGPDTPNPTLTLWRAGATSIKALAEVDYTTIVIDDSELTPG